MSNNFKNNLALEAAQNASLIAENLAERSDKMSAAFQLDQHNRALTLIARAESLSPRATRAGAVDMMIYRAKKMLDDYSDALVA
jgi:hypothetical protein